MTFLSCALALAVALIALTGAPHVVQAADWTCATGVTCLSTEAASQTFKQVYQSDCESYCVKSLSCDLYLFFNDFKETWGTCFLYATGLCVPTTQSENADLFKMDHSICSEDGTGLDIAASTCSCEVGYSVEGYTADSYDNWGSDTDAALSCCAQCESDANCDCAVLATDVSGGICMLKSDCSGAYDVGGTTRITCGASSTENGSSSSTTAADASSCSCEVGITVEGFTATSYDNWGSDADAIASCCDKCAEDVSCDCAVLATEVSGGICMLKSDCSGAYDVGGTTRITCTSRTHSTSTSTTSTTVTPTAPVPCTCSTGWDVSGKTSSSVVEFGSDQAAAASCCDLCARTDGCDCSVLATDVQGGTCMLKSDCSSAVEAGSNRIACDYDIDSTRFTEQCTWWNCV